MSLEIVDHHQALPRSYRATADQVLVFLDDHPLRVLRYSTFDQPLYCVHASLPTGDREYELKIKVKRKHNTITLHPKRLGLSLNLTDERKPSYVVRFRGHPYLVVECDGFGFLFISFDPVIPVPEGEHVLSAESAGIAPNLPAVQTEAIQAAINQVAESSTLTTLVFPTGHYRIGDLHLRSGVHLYLSSGAVLQASDHADDIGDREIGGWDARRACLINAQDIEDFSIRGHGHIDGNRSVLDMDKYFKGMVLIKKGQHFDVTGVVLSDACGWNLTPRQCKDVLIERVKLLSNRPLVDCINTDGCNPDSCQRVKIHHCFMHTGDDAVAVKSSGYTGELEDVEDIEVRDLLAINNSATAKIGTETMAGSMKRISFERIDAIQTVRLVAIDAFDHAQIAEVSWKDCHVHSLQENGALPYLIHINAPNEAFRKIPAKASIQNVTLENISSEYESKSKLLSRLEDGAPVIQSVHATGLSNAGQAFDLVMEQTG